MKRKYIFVIALLMMMAAASAVLCVAVGRNKQVSGKKDEFVVVTSFYPVYVAARNVTQDIEHVRLVTLSQPTSGCVHNHQLTTEDMSLLEQADVLIINGAGMESYLEDVMKRYPELPVIDTSEGTSLLAAEEGHLHEEAHVHEEGEEHDHVDNSHIWLDMNNYCIQIGNIEKGLAKYDREHSSQYEENAAAYQRQVQELLEEGKRELKGAESLRAVSTHEAFSYFAQNFDGVIEETVNMDENTSLSALQVSEVMEAVQEHQIRWVWTEEIYGTSLSGVLEKETGCRTLILDTLVSGRDDKNAYIDGMRKNIEALKEAADDEGDE